MKVCTRCQRTLDISCFRQRKDRGKTRRTARCIECLRWGVWEARQKKLDYYRAYRRESYKLNPVDRTTTRDAARAWAKRNKNKRRAQSAVANALRRGALKRRPCERCGTMTTHAHHDDYAYPLDVIWLCPIHHAERHKELQKSAA